LQEQAGQQHADGGGAGAIKGTPAVRQEKPATVSANQHARDRRHILIALHPLCCHVSKQEGAMTSREIVIYAWIVGLSFWFMGLYGLYAV
jgi:hypothetical protein